MVGRKPLPDGGKRGRNKLLPTIEKSEYQQMYAYYEGLGGNRTLQKVAQHFAKSHAHIAVLSRAFDWRGRIARADSLPKDPVIIEVKNKIDESRKNLVAVVHEVVDTLHELMYISKAIKGGKETDELKQRETQLQKALSVWGFEWKNPKDFASLVRTLREIKDFNVGDNAKSLAGLQAQQFNIDEFNLTIKDD